MAQVSRVCPPANAPPVPFYDPPLRATTAMRASATGGLGGEAVRWRWCGRALACSPPPPLPQRRRSRGDHEARLVGAEVLQAVRQCTLPQDTVSLFQVIGVFPIVGADRALQEQMTLLAGMRAGGGP